MNHMFCFGLGYSAGVLADELVSKGWKVSGTARSSAAVAALEDRGFEGIVYGPDAVDEKRIVDALNSANHVLLSIPPDDGGDPAFRAFGETFASLASKIDWVGYLSTTGVYGDRQGGWVDETSPLEPTTARGEKRVRAEGQWLSLCEDHGLPVHIFRLAGIYGPGSNQLEKVANGTARRRVKPGQVFSRVHVKDIAGTLRASMQQPNPGRAYNVCDDEAAPPQNVVAYAAELLGVEPPPEIPFAPEELSAMGNSFFSESKRVSNQRIKTELGYELVYPTFREGLKALVSTVGKAAKKS